MRKKEIKERIISILLSSAMLLASFPAVPTFAYAMSGITDEYNTNLPQGSLSADDYEEVPSPGYITEKELEGIYKDLTLVGKYKLNYCGAGIISGWTFNNGWSWKNISLTSSGEYNISKVFSGYENSSGSILENKDNSRIYKAYLVVNTMDYVKNENQFNDITIFGPAGQKMKVGTEYLAYSARSASNSSTQSSRYISYSDITDFVKENGYGAYYVADIPFSIVNKDADIYCSWNIVVIEENDNIDIRALKLLMSYNITKGEYFADKNRNVGTLRLGLSLAGSGLQAKVTGKVNGQLLCNWTGCDYDFMVSYFGTSPDTNTPLDMTGTARSNLGFTCGLFSIDGVPIKTITAQKDTYALPLYWDTNYYEKGNVGAIHRKTVMNGSQTDTELINIGSDTSGAKFTIPNKTTSLYYIERHPYDQSGGGISFMGLGFDIDAPTYYTTLSYDKDEYYRTDEITLTAEFKNNSISSTLGLYDGDAVINVEKDMNIESVTATFTDEKGISTILPKSMININEENVVTVGFGPDEEKISQNKDSLKVIIKGHIAKGDGEKTYESTANVRGKLITSTGLKSQYVENASNGAAYHTMESDYKVTIDFNGGSYNTSDENALTENIEFEFRHKDKIYVSAVDESIAENLISCPAKDGYNFAGWEIVDSDGTVEKSKYLETEISAYMVDTSKLSAGNIVIKAKWTERKPPEIEIELSNHNWTNQKPVITAEAIDKGINIKEIVVISPEETIVAKDDKKVVCTIETEGERTYTVKVTDIDGNEVTDTVTTLYDISSPVINSNVSYSPSGDVIITINALDMLSGIAPNTLIVRNESGDIVKTGTDMIEISVPSDEEETFTVTVYDNAGNSYTTTVSASANLQISLPQIIIADGNEKKAEYIIGVKGKIFNGQAVIIYTPDSFEMSDGIRIFTAGINQERTVWLKEDIEMNEYSNSIGEINVDDMPAGSFSGNFNVTIILRNLTSEEMEAINNGEDAEIVLSKDASLAYSVNNLNENDNEASNNNIDTDNSDSENTDMNNTSDPDKNEIDNVEEDNEVSNVITEE